MGTTTGMICSAGGIKSTMIDSTVAGFATRGLMPFGSSCLVGYIMGFAMKKIIRWALIILGVLAGMIFLAIQWMSENGYLLNGTFRDPTSDALQRFTNIGTIIGDNVYSIIYYSPAETYPVYRTIYLHMIKSFEAIPQNSSVENEVSTCQNRDYGIQIQYPSDWSEQESKSSGELINVATFLSPTGNPYPTASVAIYVDRLHNSTTNLNSYAHFVAFTDYENRSSYSHAFRLLELNTNSSILAGKSAYMLIGTYQNPSAGLQKLMEIGTIIGDKVYSVQYIADAPKYSDYLPTETSCVFILRQPLQQGHLRPFHSIKISQSVHRL